MTPEPLAILDAAIEAIRSHRPQAALAALRDLRKLLAAEGD